MSNKDWRELIAAVEEQEAQHVDEAVARFKNALAARKAAERPNPYKTLTGEFAAAPAKKQDADFTVDPQTEKKQPLPRPAKQERPGHRPKVN